MTKTISQELNKLLADLEFIRSTEENAAVYEALRKAYELGVNTVANKLEESLK